MRYRNLMALVVFAACESPTDLPLDPMVAAAVTSPGFLVLPTPPAVWSVAYGVSNNGWVAGEIDVTFEEWHAARWRIKTEGGTLTATLEDLGSLNGRITNAFDVNTSGVVVGGSVEAAYGFGPGPDEAFVYRDGIMQVLPTLGGPNAFARRINNHGWIAGAADAADGTSHPVVWRPDKDGEYEVIDLGLLGGTYGWSNTINDDGSVVGVSETADGSVVGWYWDGSGPLTPLPSLSAGGFNYTVDLNPRRLMVGNGTDETGYNHATLWEDGGVEDIHDLFPGYAYSFATAVNPRSEVAGTALSEDFFSDYDAFVTRKGQVIDLSTIADAPNSDAYDISDRGWVSGNSEVDGVPTATLWFLGAGAATAQFARAGTTPVAPARNPDFVRAKALGMRRLLAGSRQLRAGTF